MSNLYQNKMETQFGIVWHEQTEISGQIRVGNQDNSLQCKIQVNKIPANKMEAQFKIIWHEETEVCGQFKVSSQDNALQCLVRVKKVPANKMKAQLKVICHTKSDIGGQLKISSQDNTLQSRIKINKIPTNKMKAQLRVICHAQTEIGGQLKVSSENNLLQSLIKVNKVYTNKMETQLNIKLPESIQQEFTVIKDTYVTDYRPSLNYGNASIIKVGRDENGYTYRSLLQFDISSITDQMHLTKAYLKLYSSEGNKFNDLEISLSNRAWGEYNVVWYGQPSRYQIVTVTSLEENIYEYTIDVTNIVKDLWLPYPYENFGLIIKSYDENIIQVKNFGSKESNNSSKLILEYFDKDLFTGTGTVMNGSIRVQRTEWSDVQSKIAVFRHSGDSEIDGRIYAKNMDQLESVVKSSAFDNRLHGAIKVERLRYDLQATVFSNKEKLNGSITTRSISEVYGYIKTQGYTNLKGHINVVDKADFYGSFKVKPLERNDLDSTITISYKINLNARVSVAYKDDLYGNLNVIYKSDLQGKIRSTYRTNSDFNGLIDIIYKTELQGRIKVNPVGFNGKLNVIAVTSLDGRIEVSAMNELYANIITNMKSDLDGYVKVQAMDIDDVQGVIVSGENPNVKNHYRIYAFIM